MADNDKQRKDNGLDDYGIIYVSGAIDGGTSEGVCKQIIEYNIKGEVNQIQMIINSPGGSCPAGFSIIDIMEWSRIPIYTTGIGIMEYVSDDELSGTDALSSNAGKKKE